MCREDAILPKLSVLEALRGNPSGRSHSAGPSSGEPEREQMNAREPSPGDIFYRRRFRYWCPMSSESSESVLASEDAVQSARPAYLVTRESFSRCHMPRPLGANIL